jgi:hypothetical protein
MKHYWLYRFNVIMPEQSSHELVWFLDFSSSYKCINTNGWLIHSINYLAVLILKIPENHLMEAMTSGTRSNSFDLSMNMNAPSDLHNCW